MSRTVSRTHRNALRGSLVTGLLAAAPSAFAQLPPPMAPPQNPITPTKEILGKILFWEEQLSSSDTMACGTCHIVSAGGSEPRVAVHPGPDGVPGNADDIRGSAGVSRSDVNNEYTPDAVFDFDEQVTGRWSPTFLMAAFSPELFWDGRAASTFTDPETGLVSIPNGGALESQAAGPPLSDAEMAHEGRDWAEITAKLETAAPLKLASNLPPDVVTALGLDPTYPELFENAFGDDEITAERIAFAIATYERTLVPDRTPFDLGTMTPQQQQGFNIFNNPGSRCNACHPAPFFSDQTFRNIGVRPPAEDLGRQLVTGNPGDRGRFKVPSLRNAGLRAAYFHNGGQETLEDVILFYDRGGDFADNRDPLIPGINIPPMARPALAEFLRNGLADPRVAAQLPPFDRPTLRSEVAPPNPSLLGGAVAGSGGLAPSMIAQSPPNVGSPDFRLGVASGLGGALAYLVIAPPGDLTTPRSAQGMDARPRALYITAIVALNGTGAGGGFGTHHLDLGGLPTWIAGTVHAQWFVFDPLAPGGIARSEVAALDLIF